MCQLAQQLKKSQSQANQTAQNEMVGPTKKSFEAESRKVQCPNCGSEVLPGNFARHQKTAKCKCKNLYKTRAAIGKERVNCVRCKLEVCKNKIQRHMRSQKCKLAAFAFA